MICAGLVEDLRKEGGSWVFAVSDAVEGCYDATLLFGVSVTK